QFHFNSNTIFSLCKDKYKHIWAVSNANGVLKYDGKTLISITAANGLRDEQPQQLVAYDNTVFAVNAKGIDKINCQTNAVTYYDVSDKDIEPGLNAAFISHDKLYSGTSSGVLVFRTSQEHQDSVKPVVYIKSLQINYKPFPLDSVYEFKHNQNNI